MYMLHHIKCETVIGHGLVWKKIISMKSYKIWEYLYNELYILGTKREVYHLISIFLQILEIMQNKIIVHFSNVEC